jgi:type I restriction enzyme S subunit
MSEALPVGWTRVKFGELGQWVGGGTPSKAVASYWRGGTIPWVSPKDMKVARISDAEDHITQEAVANSSTRMVPTGSVLVVTRSGILAHSLPVALTLGPVAINQDLKALIPSKHVDPEFVALAFRRFAQEILRDCGKAGTTVANINMERLTEFGVPLPPLPEQRRIVARIESLFARTRRARTDLERIAPLAALHRRATLTVAASGALTEAWRDAHSDLPGTMAALEAVRRDRQRHRKLSVRHRVAAAPEIDLPPSWEWVSPDELASDNAYSIGIGPFGSNLVQSDYRPAGVRLVFVRDIRRERFDQKDARYVTPEKADELRPHVVMGGEVLITKMGDPPGDTAIYPCGLGRAVITSDCIKLQPDPRLGLPTYLAYAIRSRIVADQIGAITKGVAQQKVSLDSFRRIALPTPPIAEQREIAIRLNTSLSATDKVERQAACALALLDRLEQSILTHAFRGELVPQDRDDEPAIALLERLRHAAATAVPGRSHQPTMPDTEAIIAPRTKGPAMPKSRADTDVKGQPYLADRLRQTGSAATAEELYRAADLPIADFYKQLSEEVAKGWVKDASGKLEAA